MPADEQSRIPAAPTGLDAPVANLTELTPAAADVRETEPDDGDGRAPALTATDGTEGVENFQLPSLDARETLELSVPSDIDTLPDIATASFGPAPETVHGVDDRVQITNTADYPWRVHASLLITAADNSRWIGTGWFIGPHTLMTAGHVVYIKNSGVAGRDGFVKSIQVMPGRDGTKLPYGSATSTNFRTVSGWINNGSEEYDYGAIILHGPGLHDGMARLRCLRRRDPDLQRGQHLRLPGRQAVRYAVVRRTDHRVGRGAEGVLRHRHRGWSVRKCGVPDRQRQSVRRRGPRLRGLDNQFGHPHRAAGI